MAKKFSEMHNIPYYECDVTKQLAVPSIMKIAISVSEHQSDSVGVTDDFIHSFGLGWIITQHDIYINRLPKEGDKIKVTTLAESYNKYFCYRRFWLHDEEGNELVSVLTTFCLMDLEQRKIASVQEEIMAPFHSEHIKKIKRNDAILPINAPTDEREYRVRYLDIDTNRHVNNSVYLEWLLDTVGYERLTSHSIQRILINFNKEVRYGDVVQSRYELNTETPDISRHVIMNDDIVCAEANVYWK
ncbi:acyl-[acyl-carrier-protein] thioesterase [Vagococcus vulneris]|uniref:Acyl-[acyl-carrier-protein] thioesterase n=2 Tax=Vagococcus vulneris TaxID=1977869 RepID=A0A429ZWJ7_9ENTE|nr:acyl-[acyl-carrier-protein] thioesterase [Vagococcus vulneris]